MVAKGNSEATGTSVKEAPAVDAAVDAAPRSYSVARLIAESKAFLGVPSHVAAGALSSADGDLSVDEAQALVESFKTRVIA